MMLSEMLVIEVIDLWFDLFGNVQNKKNRDRGQKYICQVGSGCEGFFWDVGVC